MYTVSFTSCRNFQVYHTTLPEQVAFSAPVAKDAKGLGDLYTLALIQRAIIDWRIRHFQRKICRRRPRQLIVRRAIRQCL